MEKTNREKLFALFEKKQQYTFRELSKITGYHEKYLIRLYKKYRTFGCENVYKKRNKKFSLELVQDLRNTYENGNFNSYRSFYREISNQYGISYSSLCKILSKNKLSEDVLLIAKVKEVGNVHFKVVDYQSGTMILEYPSEKNDLKSFKSILYEVATKIGTPKKVCFVNFFSSIPFTAHKILMKYHIEVLSSKRAYSSSIRSASKKEVPKNDFYSTTKIDREDFYDSFKRRTTGINLFQIKNVRYKILSEEKILKNRDVIVYISKDQKNKFVKYNGSYYGIEEFRRVQSKKGLSKYS